MLAVALALGGCGAPSPQEVIPDGTGAQDGRWCAVLTEDEVAALVGEDQTDRVRQVGRLERSAAQVRECSVVWADGADYTGVVTVRAALAAEPFGGDFVLSQILPVLGEDGGLVEDGTTAALGEGVYRRDNEVIAWTVLEDDGQDPAVAEMSLYVHDELPGALSEEDLAQVGERMRDMTPGMVDWVGPARPFQPDDLAALLDAAEAAGSIGPWRGHAAREG